MTSLIRIFPLKAVRRSWLFIALVSSGLGWAFNRAVLIAEQPAPNPVLKTDAGSTSQPATVLPSGTETQREHAAMQSDPLFRAILQHFKEGRENLTTTPAEGAIQVGSSAGPADRVSPAQWQAVELILKAARILESEEKRIAGAGGTSKPTQLPSVVKQLRAQAEQIILSAQTSLPPAKAMGKVNRY